MTTHSPIFCKLSGVGTYVPEKILTNFDLCAIVDTSDEWIVSRTGIQKRHIASSEQATSDLCVEAAKKALQKANLSPDDIDVIILGTITPDMSFPSTAAFVQAKLGIAHCPVFDFSSACSGFQYGTEIAQQMITSGKYRHALLICGDKVSSVIDWKDRSTCVLFGDGAGAAIFSATEDPEENSVIDVIIGANGNLAELLCRPLGGSKTPLDHSNVGSPLSYIQMQGRDIFKEAVKTMAHVSETILEKNHMTIEDIDYVIPHQANRRIIDAIAERLKLPNEKLVITVDRFGNTSASSCLLALDDLLHTVHTQHPLKILTVSFGAGLTWGASLLKIEL